MKGIVSLQISPKRKSLDAARQIAGDGTCRSGRCGGDGALEKIERHAEQRSAAGRFGLERGVGDARPEEPRRVVDETHPLARHPVPDRRDGIVDGAKAGCLHAAAEIVAECVAAVPAPRR